MTKTEIDTRIAELEAKKANPGTFPTEIYTRIVGYYRSLANWNAGKREEYNHRQMFAEDAGRIAGRWKKPRFESRSRRTPTLSSHRQRARTAPP